MNNETRDEPAAPVEEALSAVLEILKNQAAVVEGAASELQRAQRMLPLPSGKELIEMKRGLRPVSRTVYLLWFLHKGFISLEEVASAACVEVEDGLAEAQIDDFSAIQFTYSSRQSGMSAKLAPCRDRVRRSHGGRRAEPGAGDPAGGAGLDPG